jgi:hypothetical protein
MEIADIKLHSSQRRRGLIQSVGLVSNFVSQLLETSSLKCRTSQNLKVNSSLMLSYQFLL